jgi:hypothetical protein
MRLCRREIVPGANITGQIKRLRTGAASSAGKAYQVKKFTYSVKHRMVSGGRLRCWPDMALK